MYAVGVLLVMIGKKEGKKESKTREIGGGSILMGKDQLWKCTFCMMDGMGITP